jgi:hypothetical protein
MRECRTYGSVRGVGGNAHPYRDSVGALEHGMIKQNRRAAVEQVDVRLGARRSRKCRRFNPSIALRASLPSSLGRGLRHPRRRGSAKVLVHVART